MSGERGDPKFYCSYCDDSADRSPCARCGLHAQPMTPVRDAYFLAGLAALSQHKNADHG